MSLIGAAVEKLCQFFSATIMTKLKPTIVMYCIGFFFDPLASLIVYAKNVINWFKKSICYNAEILEVS